jgi:hypothetical protein
MLRVGVGYRSSGVRRFASVLERFDTFCPQRPTAHRGRWEYSWSL